MKLFVYTHRVHGSQHQYVGLQKQLRVMENRLEKVSHTHTHTHSLTHPHLLYLSLLHTQITNTHTLCQIQPSLSLSLSLSLFLYSHTQITSIFSLSLAHTLTLSLAHTLHQASVRFNSSLAVNAQMRTKIDHLRQEKAVFEGIHRKLQKVSRNPHDRTITMISATLAGVYHC